MIVKINIVTKSINSLFSNKAIKTDINVIVSLKNNSLFTVIKGLVSDTRYAINAESTKMKYKARLVITMLAKAYIQILSNMRNHSNDDLVLMLEESLFILEECLLGDNSLLRDPIIVSHHIQTLKRFYSPDFELDFSESGSYFYAALHSIDNCYVSPSAIYHIP